MKLNRRQFLQIGALAALAGGYQFIERDPLVVEKATVRDPKLPSGLDGLKIVLLSDFHLVPYTTLPEIERAVSMANSLHPDLILLLGDFINHEIDAIEDLAPALGKLNARLGVFGVMGNHDHWGSTTTVGEKLSNAGIAMLRNRGTHLKVNSSELFLAGIDSTWCRKGDLAAAMASRRNATPALLLAHEPDIADTVNLDGRVFLQVSGHSHGGQIRLPFFGAPHLPSWGKKYDCGLYRLSQMQVYTNRGVGMVGVPVRINCPPEVTEITLLAS